MKYRASVVSFVASGLVTVASIAGAGVALAHPAKCTPRSCPAVLTNAGPWTPQLWPADLYFGQGGAPYLTGLKWGTYDHVKGVAKGVLHAIIKGCAPPSSCRYYTVKVTVTTTRPRFHKLPDGIDGGWYYSRMHLAYTTSRKITPCHDWHVAISKGLWVLGK